MNENELFEREGHPPATTPSRHVGHHRLADTLNGTTTVFLDESHSARRRPMSAAGRLGVHFITHLPRILYALAVLLATLAIAECWAPPGNPQSLAATCVAPRGWAEY